MIVLPKRETLVGWAFAALGYFLITSHRFVIDRLLRPRELSLALFPDREGAQYFFMGFFMLALLAAAGLCCVTGWGVGHQRPWSRWTGLMPCLYLLPGYPYLTAAGVLGLWFLWTQKVVEAAPLTAAEFWNPRRQSGWMLTASLLGWFVARLVFSRMQIRAQQAGLPALDSFGPGVVAFLMLMLAHIAIHECGHAVAAKAAGFRVKVLAIGPLVISKGAVGYRLRFNWTGLLLLGGYMGAVPRPGVQNFRVRQIIIIAAGPLTSLASGAILLGVYHQLPGTGLAGLWQIVAMGSVAGFYLGAINLLPLGYCDGTMLAHLLLRTRRGEELLAILLRGASQPVSQQSAGDYEEHIRAKHTALQQLQDSGNADSVQVGREYIELGALEVSAHRWYEAERHVTQGLALVGRTPRFEFLAWACLHFLRTSRYDHAGSAEAYQKALAAGLEFKEGASDPGQRLHIDVEIARLHVQAHAWAETLEVTSTLLDGRPEDAVGEMRHGMLLSWRGEALLQTGCLDAGLAAVERAAGIFRAQSSGVPVAQSLGALGRALWDAGRPDEALALVTECIMLLEKCQAMRLAAAYRLYLAAQLRLDDRYAHAACVLPRSQKRSAEYYRVRGAIRQDGGKLSEAISDLSAAVELSSKTAPVDAISLAMARTCLADALAETGDVTAAEPLGGPAYRALEPTGHHALASTCVTLAIIGWRKDGTPGGYVETALNIAKAAILLPAHKGIWMEAAAKSLYAAGLPAEGSRCLAAAELQWQILGAVPQRKRLGATA